MLCIMHPFVKQFLVLNKAFHELTFKSCRRHLFYRHLKRLTTMPGQKNFGILEFCPSDFEKMEGRAFGT